MRREEGLAVPRMMRLGNGGVSGVRDPAPPETAVARPREGFAAGGEFCSFLARYQGLNRGCLSFQAEAEAAAYGYTRLEPNGFSEFGPASALSLDFNGCSVRVAQVYASVGSEFETQEPFPDSGPHGPPSGSPGGEPFEARLGCTAHPPVKGTGSGPGALPGLESQPQEGPGLKPSLTARSVVDRAVSSNGPELIIRLGPAGAVLPSIV
jgi:hypothetical protein